MWPRSWGQSLGKAKAKTFLSRPRPRPEVPRPRPCHPRPRPMRCPRGSSRPRPGLEDYKTGISLLHHVMVSYSKY